MPHFVAKKGCTKCWGRKRSGVTFEGEKILWGKRSGGGLERIPARKGDGFGIQGRGRERKRVKKDHESQGNVHRKKFNASPLRIRWGGKGAGNDGTKTGTLVGEKKKSSVGEGWIEEKRSLDRT